MYIDFTFIVFWTRALITHFDSVPNIYCHYIFDITCSNKLYMV